MTYDTTDKLHSACDMSAGLSGQAAHCYSTLNMVYLKIIVAISVTGCERNTPQDRRLERQTTSALEQRPSYGREATQSLPLPLQRDSSLMSSSGVPLMPESKREG